MAALVSLLVAGTSSAQNGAFNTDERGLRERDEQALAAARAAIEADRNRPRIAGVWLVSATPQAMRTVDGELPRFTAAGRKLYRERVAAGRAGRSTDPVDQCLPPGTPRSLWSGKPILIAQTPAKVTLYHQYRHLIRHVFLDGPAVLEEPDPTWEGHSAGWWEGNTLRIQTIGFNGEQWLDSAGLPQSPDMKVDEALVLRDPDTLEVMVTVEDPVYYQAPWSTRVTFRRLPDDTLLPEEECSEKLLEYPLKPYAPSDGGSGSGAR